MPSLPQAIKTTTVSLALLFTTYPGHSMNQDTYRRVTDTMQALNQQELDERRDYHAYLVAERGETGSVDEHIRRYASLSRFGEPIPDTVIENFRPAIPFPADLVDFYRTYGSYIGGDYQQRWTIFDLAELDKHRNSLPPQTRFHSLGLAHMINFVWGNNRQEFELDGEYAIFTQAQIDYLNQHYQVVSVWTDAHAGDEAHYYIYYDKTGRFGLAYVHQDDWKIFHLLDASEARYSWDEVIGVTLDKLQARAD